MRGRVVAECDPDLRAMAPLYTANRRWGSGGGNSLLALAGPVDYGPPKTWCVMRKFIIFLGIGLCIGCSHVEDLQETVPEDLGETTAPGFEPDSAFTAPDRSVPADYAMQSRL